MQGYDAKKASDYWSKRINSVDQLSAVLTYNAPEYINQSYSAWELTALFRSLPKNLKGLKVLDISCGVGRISIPLAKKGAIVSGIDISEEMLKICQRNVNVAKLSSKIKLYHCNAADIPLPDKSFDIVLCLGLLEHLTDPMREKVLDQIIRTVKPRGVAIILVNNNESVFLKERKRYMGAVQKENGHLAGLINKEKIIKHFTKKGFTTHYVASNPLHSLIGHLLDKNNLKKFKRPILDASFHYLADMDICADMGKKEVKMFSDHLMIRAVKVK